MSKEAVTRLLRAWSEGDPSALDRLFPLVYDELKRIARRHIQGERGGHTLDTTGLVHEAYFKLIDADGIEFADRAHFLAVGARAMRQVLISYARSRTAGKRRRDRQVNLSLDRLNGLADDRAEEMIGLDEALDRLETLSPRLAKTVELRFFGGLTLDETAAALSVSRNTVKRDWTKAKAWLYRELNDPPGTS